ncbi:MAG: pilus assembly protein [Brevundimonas sp.]|nr:pilus assembly protein [Brevundimonas sp.]
MIFALTLPILVMVTMGGVDINRASTVRMNLQDALDAATLAAARSSAVSDADLTDIGLKALHANLANYPEITLGSATFTLNADQIVIANATVNVKTLVANIVLPPYGKLLDDTLPVGAHSEVNRSSKNIEVGLVLDITGSMSGSRIADLKTAAAQLVDIVVQTVQTPYYTRMAIIPYSIGVNVGTYADGARGAPTGATTITGASWFATSAKVVTAMSKANPAVLTVSSHGLATGDTVWISGLSDGSSSGTKYSTLNGASYLVTVSNANSFSIKTSAGANVNTTNFRTFASNTSGVITKCQVANCHVVLTSNGHGIPATTSDEGSSKPGRVYITGVGGLAISNASQVNNKPFEVANVTPNTYSIPVVGPTVTAFSSNGSSWCGQNGCQYRVFRNSSSTLVAFPSSTCVSERIGGQAYSDATPATYKVGTNYPAPASGSLGTVAASSNPCPSATLQPLTASISTLKSKITGLTVTGSTAGQIGLAWGWYSVSPNFNTLWSGNPAGAYNSSETLKAVILMTDGDFNSPYCTGVLAANAGSGSGDARDHINCNATNGDPFVQATALCDAMKLQHIVVYTVGFAVTPNSSAANILKGCATGPDYAFLPASGADLKDDFAAIGRDITRLRISR